MNATNTLIAKTLEKTICRKAGIHLVKAVTWCSSGQLKSVFPCMLLLSLRCRVDNRFGWAFCISCDLVTALFTVCGSTFSEEVIPIGERIFGYLIEYALQWGIA